MEIVEVVPGSPAAAAGLKSERRPVKTAMTVAIGLASLAFPPAIMGVSVIDSIHLGESHELIIAVDAIRTRDVRELTIALEQVRPGETVFGDNPDTHFFLWTLAWDAHAFVRQPFSIFDANIYYPNRLTLAYSENQIGSAIIEVTGNIENASIADGAALQLTGDTFDVTAWLTPDGIAATRGMKHGRVTLDCDKIGTLVAGSGKRPAIVELRDCKPTKSG